MPFDLQRAVSAKALGPHPAFMDRNTPVSGYTAGQPVREKALISQREAAHHSQAYGGNEAIDWVYDCIGLYTDGCATAPYKLESKTGTKLVRNVTKGTPPDHEVGPEDLYKLLDKPNPFMLYDELVSLLVIDLMLVGNAYWYKYQTLGDGKPLALYRLSPSHVSIKPGRYGPEAYEYQPPGVPKLKIAPENIIHFRRPNPHSAFYGLGVIQGAGRSMDLELAVTDTMASYYENNADPSMIVSSERRVPRDVFKKLGAQLRARTAGSKKSGELLVLEAGLKATTLSRSARDALFHELSTMSRDRIFTKFRASPMLFGIMDESAGANKVSDARREFDNYVLRPFMKRLSAQISIALADLWDCKYLIDYRQILPTEEAVKAGESVAKVPGIKVREVRRQYEQFGIEESTGDPELDELVLNKPMGDLGPDGQPVDPNIPSGADPNLSSEPGRPPKPANTTAVGAVSPSAKALEAVERLTELAAKAVSTPAPDNRLPGEHRPSDNFATARDADITVVSNLIQKELKDAALVLERSLLDHVEGKALKTSDVVGRVRNSPAWKTFRERVEAILEDGARRAAASGVMHSGLTPEDDVDYDAIVKSVIHRPDGIRAIIKTARDRIVSKVKAARAANGERNDLEAAVRAGISEWSSGQAAAIADTEAVHAYNEATLSVAEASGVGTVFVTDGNDHDEPCKQADGQVWEIDFARAHRLEHPRCRRAFLPLTAEAVS